MYPWIVLLHVVGAFMFVMSHGVAAWVVNEIPKQRDVRRIAALVDLSSTSLTLVYVGLILQLVGVIWAGLSSPIRTGCSPLEQVCDDAIRDRSS